MTDVAEPVPMRQARFLNGSIMKHVVVMTPTGAFGLMAMFLVDLADLFFLSLLGKTEVTAAIGYAGTIAFANLSLSIGSGIAAEIVRKCRAALTQALEFRLALCNQVIFVHRCLG